MKAASSLVRNDTVPTRSAGSSGRLIACMEAAWASSQEERRPGRAKRAERSTGAPEPAVEQPPERGSMNCAQSLPSGIGADMLSS